MAGGAGRAVRIFAWRARSCSPGFLAALLLVGCASHGNSGMSGSGNASTGSASAGSESGAGGVANGSGSELADGASDSASSSGVSSGTDSGGVGNGDAGPRTMLVGYLPDYNGSYAGYAKTINFAENDPCQFCVREPAQV